jgi:hypothetical protein
MQYTYKEIIRNIPVSEVSWKCFRCNLTFKDENIADIHKEISNHSITKIKPITI